METIVDVMDEGMAGKDLTSFVAGNAVEPNTVELRVTFSTGKSIRITMKAHNWLKPEDFVDGLFDTAKDVREFVHTGGLDKKYYED